MSYSNESTVMLPVSISSPWNRFSDLIVLFRCFMLPLDEERLLLEESPEELFEESFLLEPLLEINLLN
jgi:hypothetical protein